MLGNYIDENCQIEVSGMAKLLVNGDLTVTLREFVKRKLGVKPMQSARAVRSNLRDILNLEN